MRRFVLYPVLIFSALFLTACGYRVLAGSESLEFRNLYVAPVENMAREPGLEDLLHRALVEELSLDRRVRVVARDYADVVLETSLIRFSLDPAVEAAGTAVQYEIQLDADFRIVRKDTGEVIREIRGLGSPILTSFSVGSTALGARSSQEAAEISASRSLAKELANRILLK